jgi:hypothetical protein
LLSVVAWPFLVGFIILGVLLCATVKIKGKKSNDPIFRSGVVLVVSPVITLVVVSLFMKGGF